MHNQNQIVCLHRSHLPSCNSEVVVESNVVCDRDIAGIRTETELCEIVVENDCDDVGKMAGVIDVSKRSGSDCASGIASTNLFDTKRM
jgi:hypothetical protein